MRRQELLNRDKMRLKVLEA